MFNKDIEKLNFIVENISNIEEIIKRHDGIVNALKDKVEARPAILMAFLQIGETLNKLQNTYETLNIDDIKGAYEVRNFIAHDYMGVDIGLIEYILREKLPELKNTLISINLEKYGDFFASINSESSSYTENISKYDCARFISH